MNDVAVFSPDQAAEDANSATYCDESKLYAFDIFRAADVEQWYSINTGTKISDGKTVKYEIKVNRMPVPAIKPKWRKPLKSVNINE